MTYLHNESVNILSHLVGFVLFLGLPFMLFPPPVPSIDSLSSTAASRLASPFITPHAAPVTLYLLSTAACFLCSAFFHTVCGHSSRLVYGAGLRADAVGVLLLMWSSTVPLVEFVLPGRNGEGGGGGGSYADHGGTAMEVKAVYHALIGAVAAACVGVMLCSRRLNRPDSGSLRAAIFAGFAAVGFGLPLGHAALLSSSAPSSLSGEDGLGVAGGMHEHCQGAGSGMWLRWVGWTAACNALGWGVYGIKVRYGQVR